ncbi:MAG: hypothetical protein ABIK37_06355, partial [candidate division WOR-3 bacterium]
AGATAHPSLGLVADYLRACRAGFGDILDILDRYTSRPPLNDVQGRKQVSRLTERLPQRIGGQVSRYDAKTAVARRFEGKEPLSPRERLSRAEKLARAIAGQDRVRELLRGLWPRLTAAPTLVNAQAAANYAQQVWAGLAETKASSAGTRPRRVAGLLKKGPGAGLLPEHDIRLIHVEVKELFRRQEQVARTGLKPAGRRVAARRPRTGVRARLSETMRRNELASAMALQAVAERLHAVKADAQVRMHWLRWIQGLTAVGLRTRPGAAERDAEVAQTAKRAPDPDQAAELAGVFFAALDRWRPAS